MLIISSKTILQDLPRLLSSIKIKSFRAALGKFLLLAFLLFSYSSCTDQGCIEADDFGEYDQEILTVNANALGENCDYHPDQPLDSIEQGSGLKQCFNSGNTQVFDEQGLEYNSATGCSGFDDAAVRNICIDQCRQSCINSNSSNSSGAEPDWISTHKKESGKNIGVSLTPGAKIYIRAIGNITLGGDKSDPIFTVASDGAIQSKNNDFSGVFFDLRANVTKDVKFSGKIVHSGNGDVWGGDINSSDIEEKERAFNGARRLVAYVVPHPAGYSFDNSANSEISGTKGTPLFADTRFWTCSYSGATLNQSSCTNLPYNAHYNATNNYPNTNNANVKTYYDISSTTQTDNLGLVGGMIRYDGDELEALNLDPFSAEGTICDPDCRNIPQNKGRFIGDLNSTTNFTFTNNHPYAIRLLFKNFASGPESDNCSLGTTSGTAALSATIAYKNPDNVDIALPPQNIAVNKTAWSTAYIALEPGDSITFANNRTSFGGINCGKAIMLRTIKLQDIKIKKSGFVSFTRLANSGSGGNCTLNGRIINPKGDRRDDPNNNFDNDFYEYDSFATSIDNSVDPLRNLNVPLSNSTSANTPFDKNWSQKIFVRKGQVIRFDPASWNGTWNTGSGIRQCGIGTVIKVGGMDMVTGQIDERPAFLCRGVAVDKVPNPLCKLGTDGRCQAYSEDCGYDAITRQPKNPNLFCPIESCQDDDFSCTDVSPNCSCASSNPLVTRTTCQRCKAAKDAAANQDPQVDLNMDQCYDLENYNGKVANIPLANGFTNEQLTDAGISKGAQKLGNFNGSYGNFENLADTGTREPAIFNNNKIYRLKQILSSNVDGRLFFLIIDNNSLDQNILNFYTDNTPGATSYNGLNGYKIDLSGQQQFKNGQWLEAILCQEVENGSACSSFDVPTQVNGQPNILTIANPTVTGQEPRVLSYYSLDPSGSIIRSNIGNEGTSPDANPLSQTTQNDNFYRHSYDGTSNATNADNSDSAKKDRLNNLRISFKIKDSEVPNCDIDNPSLSQSVCSSDNCGVIVENRFYDGSVAGNIGQICAANTTIGNNSGDCKKQFFCANKYYNNSGQYQVVVKVENKNANISNIVNQVIAPVIEIMDGSPDGTKMGQAERVYREVIGDPRFQAIFKLMITVMITFYGVGYLMGVSEFSQAEIVGRIIKIGIISLFISPGGWEWFDKIFVNFFRHGTDYVTFIMASSFDRSVELQNAIANNDFYDKSILFGGIDKVFGMFFSSAVQKKVAALLFASIFGPVYLYIIYLSFFLYVYAVSNAVLFYLTAQVFISILFVLGPFFFIMLLFNQTKEMFDKWMSELIGFSLQQVFLLTTLAFFNMMMYEVIKMALGYRICWDDIWIINIYITKIKLLSFWKIASMSSRFSLQSDIGNIGNPEGIPSLFSILFIYVIASLMHKFITFMINLGASIGGSLKATAMASGIKANAESMLKTANKVWKDSVGSKIDGAIDSADRALFDSGKKADEDRKAREQQSSTDRTNRNALAAAGDAAVSEFKRNPENLQKLRNLSPEQQNKLLQEHRNKAMDKKADDLGLNAKEKKRLMEKKASISGDSLFGAMKNAWNNRDIRKEALANKDANAEISASQFKSAMKKASPEQREDLIQGVNEGNIKMNVKAKDKALQNLDQAADNFKQGNKLKAVGNVAKAAGQGAAMFAGKVATPARKAIAAPFKAIGKAAKGGAQFAKGIFGKSSYDKARDDLVEKGEIDAKAYGAGWTADQEDKDKIRARMKERSAEKKIQSKMVGDTTANFVARQAGMPAVTKFDRYKKYQSDLTQEKSAAQDIIDNGGSADEVKNAQKKLGKINKVLGKVNKNLGKMSPPEAPTGSLPPVAED